MNRPVCLDGYCACVNTTTRCEVDTDCQWVAYPQKGYWPCQCLNQQTAESQETINRFGPISKCELPIDPEKPCECFNNNCKINAGCNELKREIENLTDRVKSCDSDEECFWDHSFKPGCFGCSFIRSHKFDGDKILDVFKEKVERFNECYGGCSTDCWGVSPDWIVCENHKCGQGNRKRSHGK